MKVIAYERDKDYYTTSLWEGICRLCPQLKSAARPLVLALTGAGGKTSCREQLAQELTDLGKHVLVITAEGKYMLEYKPSAEQGSQQDYSALQQTGAAEADVVLVEADESAQQRPLKIMRKQELALPEHCAAVLAIAGLSALGKTLEAACCHWQDAPQAAQRYGHVGPLEVTGDMVLTVDLFALLWQSCVLPGLPGQVPLIPVLNQADTPQKQVAASLIYQETELSAGLITSFQPRKDD